MLKNYILVALRNVYRYKAYSLINILGLAIGITSVLIIFLVVKGDLNYESHNLKKDRIVRVNKKYVTNSKEQINSSTPLPLKQAMEEQIPEVELAAHFNKTSRIVKYGDKVFRESGVTFTSPSLLDMFTFNFIEGNKSEVIKNENSVAISESIAQKYFGDENPVGKILTFNNRTDYEVTGIFKDIPQLSNYRFKFLINMDSITDESDMDWYSHWMETFLLLKDNTDIISVESKIDQFMKDTLEEQSGATLQSLINIHRYSVEGKPTTQKYILIFCSVALLILIVACVNYMNLATAQASKRAKEVGLRKVCGANRRTLIYQFIGESAIYTIMAFIIALIFVELSLPFFEKIVGRSLTMSIANPVEIGFLGCLMLVITLFSGGYPAFLLSAYNPIKVFKSNLNTRFHGLTLRSIIVIIQFTIAIFLITSTFVIYSQLKYMRDKDVGYSKENVLILNFNNSIDNHYEMFYQKCVEIPGVIELTRTSDTPDAAWGVMRGVKWDGQKSDEGSSFGFISCDANFASTVKLNIIQGRDFSDLIKSDVNSVIINRTAKEMMDLDNPIGTKILDSKNPIIGVVEDFNFLPLNYEMEPLIMTNIPDYYYYVLVRLSGKNTTQIISQLKNIWSEVSPEFPFAYRFLDQSFDSTYRTEIKAGRLFRIFASLGIFVACLGLLGLISFITEQKQKEIGIRRVLGASIPNIVSILSQKMLLWIIIANVLAGVFSWIFMTNWLNGFVYRTSINPVLYFYTLMISFILAFLTIVVKIFKAANSNPVNALKYE